MIKTKLKLPDQGTIPILTKQTHSYYCFAAHIKSKTRVIIYSFADTVLTDTIINQ